MPRGDCNTRAVTSARARARARRHDETRSLSPHLKQRYEKLTALTLTCFGIWKTRCRCRATHSCWHFSPFAQGSASTPLQGPGIPEDTISNDDIGQTARKKISKHTESTQQMSHPPSQIQLLSFGLCLHQMRIFWDHVETLNADAAGPALETVHSHLRRHKTTRKVTWDGTTRKLRSKSPRFSTPVRGSVALTLLAGSAELAWLCGLSRVSLTLLAQQSWRQGGGG